MERSFPVGPNNVSHLAGGIEIVAHAFAPISTGGSGAFSIATGPSFGDDQYARATISAIAVYTSVVAITACVSAAGTSVYTYTLTSGAALQDNQQLYITGMQHSGNDGNFQITALGAGTFSVLNASPGANETGSSGTGNSPSDSN